MTDKAHFEATREKLAKDMQRKSVRDYRRLYAQDRNGNWGFNRDGTVLNPVWVPASPFEVALLEGIEEPTHD